MRVTFYGQHHGRHSKALRTKRFVQRLNMLPARAGALRRLQAGATLGLNSTVRSKAAKAAGSPRTELLLFPKHMPAIYGARLIAASTVKRGRS